MSKFSILPDTLKDFEYYKNKLPMYLKNSYGFIEHFRIWYDLLIGHPAIEVDVPIEGTMSYVINPNRINNPNYGKIIIEGTRSQFQLGYVDVNVNYEFPAESFYTNNELIAEFESLTMGSGAYSKWTFDILYKQAQHAICLESIDNDSHQKYLYKLFDFTTRTWVSDTVPAYNNSKIYFCTDRYASTQARVVAVIDKPEQGAVYNNTLLSLYYFSKLRSNNSDVLTSSNIGKTYLYSGDDTIKLKDGNAYTLRGESHPGVLGVYIYSFEELPETVFASGIVNSADILFELLNIFDPDFNDAFRIYNTYDEENNDLLDKIGALFGVKRDIILDDEETHLNNNNDFLTLIKCQIIKDYCDGSREQIEQYYQTVGLIVFAANDDSSANCKLILNDAGYSDDLKSLFINGLLNISSMGISYTNEVSNVLNIAVWDSSYWPEEGTTIPVWGI